MRHARARMYRAAVLGVTAVPAAALIVALVTPATASSATRAEATRLVAGLRGSLGSTVGPDRALYVTEAALGRITRVDPQTGRTSTFASGLPRRIGNVGGAMDVAFIHQTAYVLVTLVSPDVGGTHVDGLYRIDAPNRPTPIADIGTWSINHPPATDFFVQSGVQYAMQPYRGGFLVTDGHHNRVLRVRLDGSISEILALPNLVPTGLALRDKTVYLALAGPVPHLAKDGRIIAFTGTASGAALVASGAPLLVDVESGRGRALYALSQGHFTPGQPEGSPADPESGSLERIRPDGELTPVATDLDRPTSLEFIGSNAYVITLTGEVWTIRDRTAPITTVRRRQTRPPSPSAGPS